MNRLEYVASGLSHTRMLGSVVRENQVIQNILKYYFERLNGIHGHNFSLLFNAFIEKSHGEHIDEMFRQSVHTIHGDSGGLQIITQGLSITDELKDSVYKTQAKYTDIAMSFDEIPVSLVSDKSDRNDTKNRFFEKEKLEEFASLTGKNIKRQIEVFLDEKTSSRPLLIAQGNDYETYMKWTECVLKEVPKKHHSIIAGIAIAGAAIGTGPLEDIERAAYCMNLPFEMETPYIHVLGVGSIRRMLPYLTFMESGFYPENSYISYDSTTHTSGRSFGTFYSEQNQLVSLSRKMGPVYEEVFADMDRKHRFSHRDIDANKFFEIINKDSSYFLGENKDTLDIDRANDYYDILGAFIFSSIENFMKKLNRCSRSEDDLIKAAHENNVVKEIKSLLQVKDINDFLKWKKDFGQYVKSSRVSNEKPATLDMLFGD